MDNIKSRKLAKNTLLLTIRMFFLLVINLYTSRVLLSAIGVEDYGIYNVVGGVVTMFSIISGSITAAITRFITFELGKENKKRLSNIFSSSVIVQIALAFILFILFETLGLWFLNGKLNIPSERMFAANCVYQFSIITFLVNLISVPYNALIVAHEKMSAFAYIGIYEGVVKLLIAFLVLISPIDRLIFYALLLCLLAISIRIIYTIYSRKNFEESIVRWSFDFSLIKEIFSFSGWNFIGAASGLLRDQGGNIVLNLFYGPSVNAARGIAYQINHAVHNFLSSFTTALHPQITKSYASDDQKYFFSLLFYGSKISFFILFILSLPIILNTDFIVNIWLGQNPEHTVNFIRLVLLLTMGESISIPLITAMLATGKIKKYQIIVGGLNLMNLPLSYLFLKLGSIPECVFIVAIVISQLCLYARLFLLKTMISLDSKNFIINVYFRIIVVFILSSISSYLVSLFFHEGFVKLLFTTFISIIFSLIIIYYLGFNRIERIKIKTLVFSLLQKCKK